MSIFQSKLQPSGESGHQGVNSHVQAEHSLGCPPVQRAHPQLHDVHCALCVLRTYPELQDVQTPSLPHQ